jgi:hypothetical protein
MNMDTLITILNEIGIPDEVLMDVDSSWQLRQDLGLSSAETVALQSRLWEEFAISVSLWGRHDYSLDEILSLVK